SAWRRHNDRIPVNTNTHEATNPTAAIAAVICTTGISSPSEDNHMGTGAKAATRYASWELMFSLCPSRTEWINHPIMKKLSSSVRKKVVEIKWQFRAEKP